MNTESHRPKDGPDEPRVAVRSTLVPRPVGWIAAGILIGLLLTIPLRFTPVETWIAGLIERAPEATEPASELWTCPMHPDVIQS